MKTEIKKIMHSVLVILVVLSGCKKDLEEAKPQDDEIIIPSTTKVILAETYQQCIVSVAADTSSVTFNTGNSVIESIRANDIIVTDVGTGMLLKVIAVEQAGSQIILTTEQASLVNAVEKGHGSVKMTLTPDDTVKTKYLIGGTKLKQRGINTFYFEFTDVLIYDKDGDTATKQDQIIMNGSLSATPSFDLDIRIDDFKLIEMTLSITFSEEADIGLDYKIVGIEMNKETVLAIYQLQPVIFFIGCVPVVIVPNLVFTIGANGQVSAKITCGVEQTSSLTAGVAYKYGNWTPFSNVSYNFSFSPPTFNAEANARGYAGARLDFMLYGVAGPYGKVIGYEDLNIGLIPSPSASLYEGLEFSLGVYIRVFDKIIEDEQFPSVIGIREKLWEQNGLGGQINGIVKDAVTAVPLNEVKVNASHENVNIDSALSNTDGTYELYLPAGNGYLITFSKPGYLDANYYNINIELFNTTVLETVLQIDENYGGNGSIGGMIVNALSGYGVPDLSLKLRKGINVHEGEIIQTGITGALGDYFFKDLEAGHYTVEVTGSGYSTMFFTAICIGGTHTGNQDATITPVLPEDEIRIILTWGDYPWDLDSHTTGPLSNGTRYHMFYPYSNTNWGSPWPDVVTLDLDDITSFGPETTTLYQQIDGIYRFSVHDYTNRYSSYSMDLSNSGAQVRIYGNTGLLAQFNIPPNREGTLWTVFEMSGETITPVNTFSYVSDPSGINAPFNGPDNEFNYFPVKAAEE